MVVYSTIILEDSQMIAHSYLILPLHCKVINIRKVKHNFHFFSYSVIQSNRINIIEGRLSETLAKLSK